METAITTELDTAQMMESVIVNGDLSKLTPAQRVQYYMATCRTLGLNPTTKPFDYIQLSGRLTLYARKDATDQLRRNYRVSITKLEREKIEDIYTVTAYASTPDGRQDSSIGAVCIANVKGDALANAIMKAETKSKRRVTLSICGLGMLDESEVETIPNTQIFEEPVQAAPTATQQAPTATQTEQVKDNAPMTLEQACAVTNSEGKIYGGLPTDKLSSMANALGKLANITPEQETKLLAIQIILAERSKTA
jgi:hypothetical protein